MDSLKIKKNTLDEIGLVFYLFCFIFAPPIIPKINFIFVVFVYSLIQLYKRKRSLVKSVFIQSKLKCFCTYMILAYFYIIIIMLFGMIFVNVGLSNYIKTIYRFILIIPITVTCILYILVRAKEMQYDIYELIYAIIKAGLIQATLAIVMFLSPSIKQFLVNIMFANTGDDITQNLWVYQRRLYAFSNSILDSFGYGTGVIATLPIFLAFKRKVKYLFYVPFLLIVPLLNSRTGLIIFGIGLAISLPLYLCRMNIKRVVKTSISILLILFCINIGYGIVKEVNPTTVMWVENGISDFISLFSKDNEVSSMGYTESVSSLFNEEKWYLPNSIGLIFGTGHNVYQAKGFKHSDVGYINDLWLGGVVGVILFYSPLIVLLIMEAKNKKQRELKYLLYYLLLAFIVANIKGYMINYNVGMAVTLSILFSESYLRN